jgi:membrane protease YdiL (CAAX protease family)
MDHRRGSVREATSIRRTPPREGLSASRSGVADVRIPQYSIWQIIGVWAGLWLRSPRSARSGRRDGRVWLILVPLVVAFGAEEFIPDLFSPGGRDLPAFLASDAGQSFFSGNWAWFGLILVQLIFVSVLGEELLFRGLLLPRMNGAFGRDDWVANGVLFAVYHLHIPWAMLASLLDAFVIVYPTKRYQSA